MTDNAQNLHKRPIARLLDYVKMRLSWFEHRKYIKIIRSSPLSSDMEIFQSYYKELYGFGDALHIDVDTSHGGVKVPRAFIQEGKIVLDISPRAIAKFEWTQTGMRFKATFNKKSKDVEVPLSSLTSIYNRETGLGFHFGNHGKA